MPEPEEEPGYGNDRGDLLSVLSTPLGNDDALTTVLTRRPRAKLPSLTVVLVVLVVASAGFIGGVLTGKHYGSSGSGGAAGFSRLPAGVTLPSGAAGGSGGSFGGFPGSGTGGTGSGGTGTGGGFGTGNATIGTIKLVDGKTVYVQTTSGSIVQVTTSSATKVTVSTSAPVKDLTPGTTVIVQGSKNSSGGVTATSISQTSLGG
jgi:hypothetical protein